MREIARSRFGGPEVLEARVVADSAPRPGEVRIRQTAVGVNFTDVHGRRGDYDDLRTAPMPLVLGMEAAGGVGALAGQWLRAIGARAIGIVGAEDKVGAARAAGYEAVFVRGRDDWPARVRELSGGGVPVVYDPVGRDTWEGSLSCLAPRGHLVCYGNSSGLVPPFSVNGLRDCGIVSLIEAPSASPHFTASPVLPGCPW